MIRCETLRNNCIIAHTYHITFLSPWVFANQQCQQCAEETWMWMHTLNRWFIYSLVDERNCIWIEFVIGQEQFSLFVSTLPFIKFLRLQFSFQEMNNLLNCKFLKGAQFISEKVMKLERWWNEPNGQFRRYSSLFLLCSLIKIMLKVN